MPSTASFSTGHLFGAGGGAALAGPLFAGVLLRVVCAGNIAHASASMGNHFIPSWYGSEPIVVRAFSSVGVTRAR